jgi:hypothetical protein
MNFGERGLRAVRRVRKKDPWTSYVQVHSKNGVD